MRRLSIALASMALLAWTLWVGTISEGFTEIKPLGWLIFIGAPLTTYLTLRLLLPLLRKSTKDVRLVLSGCAMWVFSAAAWGYIWRWERAFTPEQFAALLGLPPVGLCLALVLWRWSKAA